MELTLIRHPPVQTPKGLCYGQSDVPAVRDFAVHLTRAGLRELEPANARVYSSDLRRCLEPARDLFGDAVRVDDRLRELDFGAWEGRLWDDLPKDDVVAWCEDPVHRAPPGGETFSRLIARCESFLHALPNHPSVIIVTHAGWMRACLSVILDIAPMDSFRREIPNCGRLRLRIDHARLADRFDTGG